MSLPVHDDVMMRMLEALVQVGATAKSRRQMVSQASSQQLQLDSPLPPLGCRGIS
jgi:hypothetical protein